MAQQTVHKGALIGWIISGVLIFIVVGGIGLLVWSRFLGGSVGEPTAATKEPGALSKISLKTEEVEQLAGATHGEGAEEEYNQAIKVALNGKETSEFGELAANMEPLNDARLKKVIDLLVAAGEKGMGEKTEWVSGDLEMGPLTDMGNQQFLLAMGHVLTNASLQAYGDQNKSEGERKERALKYSRAALRYGQRLWQNGVYSAYKYAGLSVMGDALAGMQMVYKESKDGEGAAAATELDGRRREAGVKWLKKDQICRSTKPVAGDLANLLANDKDRAWRIQGAMWLGVAQWTSVDGKDREAVKQFLAKYSKDSDPVVAEQAEKALKFERSKVQELAGS